MKLIDAINQSDRIIFDSYNKPLEVTANKAFIETVIRPKILNELDSLPNYKSSTDDHLVWTIDNKIFATFSNHKNYSTPAKKMIIKYYVYKKWYKIF